MTYQPRPTAYVVQIAVESTAGRGPYRYSPASWHIRKGTGHAGYGRPTVPNLVAYVRSFEASTAPGGVNAHLGRERVTRAFIRENQGSGRIVASAEFGADGQLIAGIGAGVHRTSGGYRVERISTSDRGASYRVTAPSGIDVPRDPWDTQHSAPIRTLAEVAMVLRRERQDPGTLAPARAA